MAHPHEQKEEKEGVYQAEIKSMMYACGDIRSPDSVSSLYLEQIVQAQARALLNKAYEVTRVRGGRSISVEDLVFVFRNDPHKVRKLSNFVYFKDVRRKVKSEVLHINTDTNVLKYDWLPRIDGVEDAENTERLKMIDEITGDMTKEEYLDFTECRQASFTFRKAKRFRDFLGLDYKLRDEIIDIVGFVAYEMLFEIVSLASKVRQRKNQRKIKISSRASGLFRTQQRKTAITDKDIDEACRRIVLKRGSLY